MMVFFGAVFFFVGCILGHVLANFSASRLKKPRAETEDKPAWHIAAFTQNNEKLAPPEYLMEVSFRGGGALHVYGWGRRWRDRGTRAIFSAAANDLLEMAWRKACQDAKISEKTGEPL